MNYREIAMELFQLRSSLPHRQMRTERRRMDIFQGELFVLNYLFEHESWSYPKELSRNLVMSTARVAAILRTLQKNGLLTRTTDPKDNRQIIVRLTEEGRRRIEERRENALDYMVRMLEYLGPEDAQAYLRIQKKLMQMSCGKG
ncbi:MAG: MarR family winged helix-turn-helix transcriptional regulator [Butyricicoccus sp.]